MMSIRKEIIIWTQIITFVIVWLIVLFIFGISPIINWKAIKVLPEVVTIYTVLHLIFIKWTWRLHIFQHWLVIIPIIQGTWKGILQTTWVDPKTNETPQPISIYLVIRQTYNSINVTMFTRESISYSEAATIIVSEESGTRILSYNYTNTPCVILRDRSRVHEGAATLRISTKPNMILEGEYWTNRKTTGQIRAQFLGRHLIERFPEEEHNRK